MKTLRVAALTVLLTGTAVGLASPASAEPLSGTYTAEVIGRDGTPSLLGDSPWVFTPCGADCTRSAGREFRLHGNTWVSSMTTEDGVKCTTTFDNNSLSGMHGCSFMTFPMRLTKIG